MRALPTVLAAALWAAPASAGGRGELVHLTTRPWLTLDPAAAFDPVSLIATGNVYEPLVTFGDVKDPSVLIPFLAAAVPTLENGLLSADRTTYRFPIRKGVRFHDGAELTPEDARYSLLRFMLADESGGPAALLLEPLLGVGSTRGPDGKVTLAFSEAADAVRVDGEAVVVRLKRPDSAFLKLLASLPIVVCRAWAAAHGEWDGSESSWTRFNNRPPGSSYLAAHMDGTGPFRFLEAASSARQLVLGRHAGYWRRPASLEQVTLRVVASKAVRLSMLESGAADISYFDARDYEDARALRGVKVVEGLPGIALGEAVFFTFSAAPGAPALGSGRLDGAGIPPDFFAEKAVREGFGYALDYDDYLKRGLSGRGRRSQGPIPSSLVAFRGVPPFRFDLERARAALRKARAGAVWENGFTVTLTLSPSNANRLVLAEVLRDGLAKVNPKFTLRVKTVSSAELYAAAERHELPLFIASYDADYPDPHSFAYGMLDGDGYYPRVQGYRNPALDRRIAAAAAMAGEPERLAAYQEIVRLGALDIPHLTTFEPARFIAARADVSGLDGSQNVSNLALDGFPYFYAYSKE